MDFIKIVFCFFNIYDDYFRECKDYDLSALEKAKKDKKEGNNPEFTVTNYKDVKEPPLVKLYGNNLHDFILNSANNPSDTYAMEYSIKDVKKYLIENNILIGAAELDSSEKQLMELVDAIDEDELKIFREDDDEFGLICVKEIKLSKWCTKQEFKCPDNLITKHDEHRDNETIRSQKESISKKAILKKERKKEVICNLVELAFKDHYMDCFSYTDNPTNEFVSMVLEKHYFVEIKSISDKERLRMPTTQKRLDMLIATCRQEGLISLEELAEKYQPLD